MRHCPAGNAFAALAMTTYRSTIAALACCALLGCSGGDESVAKQPTPMPTGVPGTYAGEFPCGNCSKIAATLWLRADERFFFRQIYLDEDGATASTAYSLGRWHWDDMAAELVLTGPGPERRLAVGENRQLSVRTASALPHVLAADASVPAFADRIELQGESGLAERSVWFKECYTGLEMGVVETKGFKELRRLHRELNSRGKAALATVEAHLVPSGESSREMLVVDRVLGLKPRTSC
jgi:NlpE-like protein